MTGERVKAVIPRWLYRGEAGSWPTTTSSMQRIKSHQHPAFATLPTSLHNLFAGAIEAISLRASAELEAFLKLGQMQAAGLAQHYELPSEFLDLTSSLSVAAAFAVGNPSKWTEPKVVHFAVLDMHQAIDRCVIADLASMVQIARRPAIQQAYGFWHESHRDLKNPECIAEVGLHWHEILAHPEEARINAATANLMDAHKDRAAGILQLILDDLAKTDQKWPDEVAQFLSSMVAAAPFVTRVTRWNGSKPAEVELVAAEDAGYPFDKTTVQGKSRQLWSRASPGITSRTP